MGLTQETLRSTLVLYFVRPLSYAEPIPLPESRRINSEASFGKVS